MDKRISSNRPSDEPEGVFVPGLMESKSVADIFADDIELETYPPVRTLPEKKQPPVTPKASASDELLDQLSPFDPVAAFTNPEWKSTGIYTLANLSRIPTDECQWLVHNLIREGNQVVLSGPPKSGKTLLALQLAIDVGVGGPHFLDPKKYQIPKPQSVLFISLEMRQRGLASRLEEQWSTADTPDLRFMFGVPNSDSHTLFKLGDDGETVMVTDAAKELQKQIKTMRPKLIILDSLIQVHSLDENNNMQMGALMRLLRRLFSFREPVSVEEYQADYTGEIECINVYKKNEAPKPAVQKGKNTKKVSNREFIGYRFYRRKPIAHVILHHTRKGSDMPGKPLANPDSIRGASSIHSEVDLAITLANAGVNLISLNKSARELPGERTEFYVLKSDADRFRRFEPAPPKDEAKKEVLARIYKGLRAAGVVYAETVSEVLKKKDLLKELTRGKTDSGFRDAFVKRLATAKLNARKPAKGSGNRTQIELIADSDMGDFFAAFHVDANTASAFENLPALEFAPVESTGTSSDPQNQTPATKAVASKEEAKKKVLVRIYKGLRAAHTVYGDSIYDVLMTTGLINEFMRGKSIGGFRDAFVKKLATAGLNVQKPSKGAGHKTQIELNPNVDLGTFLKAFYLDLGDAADFENLPAVQFPPVEPEKPSAENVKPVKTKPKQPAKSLKKTSRTKARTRLKKMTKRK